MPVVKCSSCNTALSVPDQGGQFRCPKCKTILAVPGVQIVASPPKPPPTSPTSGIPTPNPAKPSSQEELTYIGKGLYWWRICAGHVAQAKSRFLTSDEKLLAMVKGRVKAHATKPSGFFSISEQETNKGGGIFTNYLIVTDQQVILWARGFFKRSVECFHYADITGVEQQSGWIFGGIVLSIHGTKANFTEMHQNEAVLVAEIIRRQLRRAREK